MAYEIVQNGLTLDQYIALSDEKRAEYDALDSEAKGEFAYFWGFTRSEYDLHVPTNAEIELYKAATDKIELKTVAQLLGFVPHIGQQPIFYTFDRQRDVVNNIVMVLGRRAQPLDSKILTPTGHTTFSDVKPGDVILDPKGGTQQVTAVHDIYEGDVYRVTLQDGRSCKVDSQHLFGVTDHHNKYRVLDVDYLNKTFSDCIYSVELPASASYTASTTQSMYTVGVNAYKHSYSIPTELLLTPHDDRVQLLKGIIDAYQDDVKQQPKIRYDMLQSNYSVTSSLDTLSDVKQLSDSPTTFSGSIYVISVELASDIVSLIRSLGGLATETTSIEGTTIDFTCYSPMSSERKIIITNIEYLGREPVRCITVSATHQLYLTDDYIVTHNTGKSISTSIIGIRELLVPYSSTILLTPTFNNAKIIFNEVLKHVQKLKLPIKSINKGAFRFELENGARFSANSEANIESALGTYNSLLIVDEAQSFENLEHIMNQMLVPTLLDYGTRPSGILYGRQIFLGTPRGEHNILFSLYSKQDEFQNWKSFNAPSTVNPILPKSYFEQMRLELGDMLYRQEILAEFIGTGDNVFWAYDPLVNLYKPGDILFTYKTPVIAGIDVGARDSTALVLIYRTASGDYYVDKAYTKNMTSTSTHITNYREYEDMMLSKPEMRYMDPSAAQLIIDYTNDYNYECVSANNAVQESIKYINQLLTPTGANNRPKLFFNVELKELIRQVSRVRWKDSANKTSKDPFIKDPKKTHWDLIAALRYALYSDQFNMSSSIIIESSSHQVSLSVYDKLRSKALRC